MAFRKHSQKFKRKVAVRSPEFGEEIFFIFLSAASLEALFSPLYKVDENGNITINSAVQGWEGFADLETGKPLDFTPENWKDVLDDPFVNGAIFEMRDKFVEEIRSGKLAVKNSEGPRAGT